MRDLMKITKALADENRIRALLALRRGELCACQITELFGLAPSTISKHMSILYQAGLVDSRKEGRWMYFRLPNRKSPTCGQESDRLDIKSRPGPAACPEGCGTVEEDPQNGPQ